LLGLLALSKWKSASLRVLVGGFGQAWICINHRKRKLELFHEFECAMRLMEVQL
jgi:hypothetical protein